MKRRLISFVLALVMVLGMLPVPVFATENTVAISDAYCTITPALQYEEETISYSSWGWSEDLTKYTVQLPSETQTVTLTLGNSYCLTPDYLDPSIFNYYYTPLVYNEDYSYYESGYSTKVDSYTKSSDSESTIELDVADLIESGSLFGVIDSGWTVQYAIEFVYVPSGEGHTCNYVNEISNTATCTEAGTKTLQCDSCDKTTTVASEALGHSFGDWSETKAPTCKEAGEESRSCGRTGCNETETREVAKLTTHDYSNGSCTVCGEADPDAETGSVTLPLEDGTLSPAQSIVEDGEVSCYQYGYDYGPLTKYKVQIPAETETVTITFGANASLNFVLDWVTWEQTGDINYGILTYSEDADGYGTPGYTSRWKNVSYTETDGGYSIEVDVASLIQAGKLYHSVHEDGSARYALEFVYVSSGDSHECSWDAGEVTKEATCKETGIMTYTCTVGDCGKTRTEEIPLADHNWDEGTVTKEPTCQTAGEKTKSCTYNCGTTTTETIAASDAYHKWDDGKQTTAPTCKDKGVKTFTCTVDDCGETKTEDIPVLTTHSYGEDGNAETCIVCGIANPNYVDPNMPALVEGVYQIGTAEQLLSFAKFVNKGNTNLSAVLTANIDLTGKTWTPMTSSNAAFSFNGQGHTITFDGASNGLFAVLRGKWNSKNNYNIDAYATVNNVIVTGTISGTTNVAAIAGEAYGVKITNCENRAAITGSGNNVGGIMGLADKSVSGLHYSNVTIDGCANTGAIEGNSYVGGLAGYLNTTRNGYPSYVQNGYNWGPITGSNAGGLIGYTTTNITVSNCYNTGSAAKALVGSGSATISNSYYLSDDSGTSGQAKTDTEMKSAEFVATLGEYFRKSSTYPILSWQAAGSDATEYNVTKTSTAGVTFLTGEDKAYSTLPYVFSLEIQERYRKTNDFAIQVNGTPVEYTEEDGIYSYTVETVSNDLVITVLGVEATKTVIYTGNSLPTNNGYVTEIAIDDVTVSDVKYHFGETIQEGTGEYPFYRTENTIYVTLAAGTPQDAEAYFTVATGGVSQQMLSVTPGKSFTSQLTAGGLTQVITAEVLNSGKATWTVVVTVDGVVSHNVTMSDLPEGVTVEGASAVVDGQNYPFTVEIGNGYIMGEDFAVKVNGNKLDPDEEGGDTYTVSDVTEDLTITVEGVTRKPFEDPFTKILVGGSELPAGNIALQTKDFHLGGKGTDFNHRVYEDVPYYHVIVPDNTANVDVIFKANVDIQQDSREGKENTAYGYETDIDSVDAVTSATIRGKSLTYVENEDGTKKVTIPVTGYTVGSNGGKAIGPEAPEAMQNRPVSLFSFRYGYTVELPDEETFTVIPMGEPNTVLSGEDYSFTVRTAPGYIKGNNFAVKANETTLTPGENGVYTIENVTSNQVISVSGVEEKDTVTVYLSVSHDAGYLTADNGKVMALQKVELPWFDLAPYGMDQYSIPSGQPGYQEPTALHLYIYAMEVFHCGVPETEAGKGYLYEQGLLGQDSVMSKDQVQNALLVYEGAVGSIYFKKFWGMDENLNYYHNYVYPATNGVGITAENLVLEENDVMTVGHFSSWDFKDDPTMGFNYLKIGDSTVETSVNNGSQITFSAWRAGGAGLTGGQTTQTELKQPIDLYYTNVSSLTSGNITGWTNLGTTDENGKLTATIDWDKGQYIIAMAGRNGTEIEGIVSAPGAILLTVQDGDLSENPVQEVIGLIDAIGSPITLESKPTIVTARTAYDLLTEDQKEGVTNYQDLLAAEAALKRLQDQAEADAVIRMIGEIGEVTLEKESAITAARTAYDKLTADQKTLVTNFSTLTAAEKALEELKKPIPGEYDVEAIYKATGDHLAGLSAPGVGSTDGEWRVIGLKRSGRDVSADYYRSVVDYVTKKIDSNERLDPNKSTDNSRVILALTAMGYDVTSVAGHNLLAGLNDMNYVGKQGVNGYIWALIALDSHAYDPSGNVTRTKLIDAILAKQKEDGGWATSSVSDPDMTGMAIQALAPYYNQRDDVKTAVDKALVWLSQNQNADGSFSESGSPNSESIVQVIVALSALNIDADTDSRFIKNGTSALDALCSFALDDGTFEHGVSGGSNTMATEQGYYALTAYFRMKEGKNRLYDMTDVSITKNKYQITEGDNSTWQQDGGNLTIKSNADYAKFVGVKVDGEVVASENYTASEGSTAVTFKAAYLKTLSLGSHTVTVVSNDGEASTMLTVALSNADEAKKVEDLISAIGTVTKDSSAKIKAARDAYDQLTDAQKTLVKNYSTLVAAEKTFNDLATKITVYFTLLGDSNHGDKGSAHTYAGGGLSTWISSKAVTVKKPATVWDVFKAAVTYSYTNSGNYISSINGLAEFSNGTYSGWMYTLNGNYPNLGVEEQSVSDGDVIVFHYTDDYRVERAGFSGSTSTVTVQDVIRLIKNIGTVTLDREDAIKQARAAYDKLSESEKAQVYNYEVLTAAEKRLSELQIQDAINKINAIGTVSLNSGSKIDTAWNAYNALSVEQKEKVTNFSKLVKAQDTYNTLRAEEAEKLIDEIDETVTLDSEKAILEARKAYDALTENQKKLVDKEHLDKLKAAELALANLKATDTDKKKAQDVIDQIDKLGTITLDSEEAILAARKAYDKLTDIQKALVTNYEVLEAAEKKLEELKRLKNLEDIYVSTGDYMENLGAPSIGSVGGEWMVIGLARSGREVPGGESYYESVLQFVQENADEHERLHWAKSTENSRVILALTAIGKDVTDVGGHNLLKGLNDLDYLKKQGINGPIWALIALDSGNYPVPEGNVTREALIDTILSAQLGDGGWALSGNSADPDMTGMALQALAPYYQTNEKVKAAVDSALTTVSLMQYGNGGFAGIDGESSESVTQILVALAALGIDPEADERFIKNDVSVLDALAAYYVSGGGFKHIPDGKLDGMATEQGYYALTAYFRMLEGKTSLYDMTDMVDMGGDPVAEETGETVALPVETAEEGGNAAVIWISAATLSIAAIVVLLLNRKKLFGKFL